MISSDGSMDRKVKQRIGLYMASKRWLGLNNLKFGAWKEGIGKEYQHRPWCSARYLSLQCLGWPIWKDILWRQGFQPNCSIKLCHFFEVHLPQAQIGEDTLWRQDPGSWTILLYTSRHVCYWRYGTTCHNFQQLPGFYASRQAWHTPQQDHPMGQMQTELWTSKDCHLCASEDVDPRTGHDPRGRTPLISKL